MAELPASLAWLKYPAGMEWPEGEEDQLWGLSDDWKQAAADLRAILDDIDTAKAASLAAYPSGQGVEQMIKDFDSMRSGDGGKDDQSLEKLAEVFDDVAKSVFEAGTEIEYTKIMFVSSLALLAAEIALCWVPPTPASPVLQATAIGLTRVAVRVLGQTLARALVRIASQAAVKATIKFLARHVAIDFALGTLQELGTQAWQVSQGHRDEINDRQLLVTMVSSAAGGAAAGPFAGLLGDKLIKDRMNKWLKAAITGPAAGLMGAEAGNLAAIATQLGIDWHDTGSFDKAWDNATKSFLNHDPLMFTAGASNGLLSSLSGTGAHTFKNRHAPIATPDAVRAPTLGQQVDAIVGIDRSEGGGASRDDDTTRTDDGPGARGDSDDGPGSTRSRSEDEVGVGEHRAGDGTGDGANAGVGGEGGPARSGGGAGLGTGGGDGSTMRPAATSGGGHGDSGSRAESAGGADKSAEGEGERRAGDAGDSRRAGESGADRGAQTGADRDLQTAESGADPDAQTGESGGDQGRAGAGDRASGLVGDHAAGPGDSMLSPGMETNAGQRAGVPVGADGPLGGADLGLRGEADSSTQVTNTADAGAAHNATPVVAHAAPAAANSAPAAQAPGEMRGGPAASTPARGAADLRNGAVPVSDSSLPARSGEGVTDSMPTTDDSTVDRTVDADGDSAVGPLVAADGRVDGLADGGSAVGPRVAADGRVDGLADGDSAVGPRVAADGRVDGLADGDSAVGPLGTADRQAGVDGLADGDSGAGRAGVVDGDATSPRVGESRAGLADTGRAADSASTVRADHADSVVPERVVGESGESRTTTSHDAPDVAVAPILPIVPGDGATPQAGPRRRAGIPLNEPTRVNEPARADIRPDADRSEVADRHDPDIDRDAAIADGAPIYGDPLSNGQRVVYTPTGTAIGNDASTANVRDNLRNDGRHDLVVHGNRAGHPTPGHQGRVDPADIARALLDNPYYTRGTPVRLMSCYAGADGGWARQLAILIDAPVTAPTREVGARNLPDQPAELVGGRWETFGPDSVDPGLPADPGIPPRDPGALLDGDRMGERGRSRSELEAALGGPLHTYPDPGGNRPRHQGIVDELLRIAADADPRDLARGAGPRAFVVDQYATPTGDLVGGGKPYAMVVGLDPATGQHRVEIIDPDTGTRHPHPAPTPRDLHTVSAILMDSQGNVVPPRALDPRHQWQQQPDPRQQPDPQQRSDLRQQPDPQQQSDPQQRPDLRQQPDPQQRPDPRQQPDPQQRPDPRQQPDPQQRPDPRQQPDPQQRPDPRQQPDPQQRPDPRHQPDPQQHPDPRQRLDPSEPPVRFYDPEEAYEAGRDPSLPRDAPFGPAVDGTGSMQPDGGTPRSLEELRRANPARSFDELMALREAAYREAGIDAPPLSRESLDALLEQVWADRDSVRDMVDVYDLYSRAPEPNTVSDVDAYLRELGEVIDGRSDTHRMMLQAGMNLPMEPGQSAVLRDIPWHFVHFQRTGDAGRIPVGYRVYVNPRIDAAPSLMRDLVRDIIDRPDAFPGVRTAKITSPTAERADAVVIYVRDLDDVHQVTQWLRDYRDRSGDVFLFDAPPMTDQVLDGVGVGAHPPGKSFGQVRAEAILQALDTVRDNGGTFADFQTEVRRALPAAGVDPDNPHLRHTPPPDGFDRMSSPEDGDSDRTPPPDDLRHSPDDGDSGRTPPPDDRTARGDDDETPSQRAARIRAELADLRAQVEANRAEFLHDLADSTADSDPRTREGESPESIRARAEQADWNARQHTADADLLWNSAGGRPDTPTPTPDPRTARKTDPTDTSPNHPDPARTVRPDPSAPDPRLAYMMDRTDSESTDPQQAATDPRAPSMADRSDSAVPDPRVAYMMDRADSESTPPHAATDPRVAYMTDRADSEVAEPPRAATDPRVGYMADRSDSTATDPRVAYSMDPTDSVAAEPPRAGVDPQAGAMVDRADSGVAEPPRAPTDPRVAYMMDGPDMAAADAWARGEYDRLMAERQRLAREMEFWRAKRDDRVTRLMGIADVEGAVGSPDALADTMRRLADDADSRSTPVAPVGEEAGGQVDERRSEADAAHRRRTAAKLEEAARRVIRMREELVALDRRIDELAASGALDGRPASADTAAELDRLAKQRADELLRIKPRRAMRDDLAQRLGLIDPDGGIAESALSPENLAATIDGLRDTLPADRRAEIDALAEAARDVNEAHNRIGRLQDQMALVAGAARTDIEGAGGRMLTRDIGVIDGDPPRLVVYGPRDQLGYQPRPDGLTDHEFALRHALSTADDVVRAFVRDHASVEFRRITADRVGNARVDPMPEDTPPIQRRTIDYTISDPHGGEVRLEIARWRSADGTWHDVDDRPTRWENRTGTSEVRKPFEGRMLPEGVSSVGVTPTQAAIVDAVVGSSGDGVNEAFLPKLPGGLAPANPGLESHVNDVPDAASNLMRMILETMKFAGWSWFQDPENPEQIRPGFKRKRLFRRFTAEQQPFVPPAPDRTTVGRTDPTEAIRNAAARAQRRAEWARVQRWADEQYDAFLRDDSDLTAIAETLRQQHSDAQRAQARDMVDRIRSVLDEAAARLPDGDAATRRRALIDQLNARLADPEVRFTRNDTDSEARRDHVRRILDWLDADVPRDVIADAIAHQFTTHVPELTPQQVDQVKHLLMRDSLLMNDPDSGERRWRRLDRLAHVAEAWHRLSRGEPEPGDLLLVRDAWEWSQRVRESYGDNDFTRTWEEFQDHIARSDDAEVTPNQRRFTILTWEDLQNQVASLPGDHWADHRTPLTEWRAGIAYEPPVTGTVDNPAALEPPPDRNTDGPDEDGPEAVGGRPAGDPPSRPPAAPGRAGPDPDESFDRMGDEPNRDATEPDSRGTDRDPVPPGMFRDDDGLLHRPGDRVDSYRDPDGRLHHHDDAPNTYRDKNFGYHDAVTHWFIDDHLSATEYEYLAMKGESRAYDVIDPVAAQELRDASALRLALQAERDPIAAQVKRLMAQFDIERVADLATERLGGEIQRQQARIEADPTLDPAEMVDKLAALADLEDLATAYNDLGPQLVEASKQLGELAGLAFALDQQARPGAVLLSPFDGAFDGAGTVDIAALVPGVGDGAPTLVVVEAKGVGSTLGGSKTARAEQGSPEYLRRTLAMDRNLAVVLNESPEQRSARGLDPNGAAGRALGDAVAELRTAQRDGTLRVEYHLVHASARGEVTVTDLLLERDGVNILADVPLPLAELDIMGSDDLVIHRLGDSGDELPPDLDGQPYGWQLSAPDRAAVETRELLSRTTIGREALAVLDAVDAHLRFGALDDPAPTAFDGRTMEVFVGADGPVARASEVVRAAALADAVLDGRVETTPARIRALDRAEHIAARVRAEAEAFGRQAEFHREVGAAGHDPLGGRDPVDAAVRRTLDDVYLAAHDAAIAEASDATRTPEQLRRIGREAGVARLLEHELFDAADGFAHRDDAAADWDAHRDPARLPGLTEYAPSDRETARELERLMRAQAAAARTSARIEADWDLVCDRLVRGFNLPVDELPGTRREIADLLLRRAMDINIWHGMDNATLLSDLTARHTRAAVDRARLVDEITDLVRADLARQPEVSVDVSHVRVHGDESGVLHLITDAQGPAGLAPASWLSDPVRVREALTQGGVEHAALVDRVDRQYLRSLGVLEAHRVAPWARPGRWAARQLSELGVSVRYSHDPEYRIRRPSITDPGTAPAYDPVTNTLVLDPDGTADQHAGQLIFAARMADLLATDGLPERFTHIRDEYVDLMTDRVADALALAFRFDAERAESISVHLQDRSPLRRAYDAAYEHGLRTATKVYAKLGSVTTDELFQAAAHRAGVRAVRAALVAHGPRVDGRAYPDHFGADWDRARGITPPPGDSVPAPAGSPRPDARAPYLALEIETLRMLREGGAYVPVSPAERAYTDAYDKAHAKAERAQRRDPGAPPPREVAAEAGRAALRRYLNRVGPETAELVLDVVRAAGDAANPHWGMPALADAPALPVAGEPVPAVLAERALAEAAATDPDGMMLTPRIADFRYPGLFTWRSLHVVAEPGGHLAALLELAALRPEYERVVWDSGTHDLKFAVPERGPGGETVLRYLTEQQAMGPLRRPTADESAALLLDHYLRYRADGQTTLGFGDWTEQLGPEYFRSESTIEQLRLQQRPGERTPVARFNGDLHFQGVRDAIAGPPPAPPHPAEVVHRVATRALPLLPPAADHPAHIRRETFTLGPFRVDAQLEPDGYGGWRVPTPRGDASLADALAARFHGMSDSDPARLVDRIARMLADPTADLDDHGRPRGRLGRFVARLSPGSDSVVQPIAVDSDAGEPRFVLRPPWEDVDTHVQHNEQLLGVPGPDEWSGLSPEQVGARLRDELARVLDRPEMTTSGFDLPGLNWQVVQEFARGVVDMATAHPHVDLRAVRIGELPMTVLARTESRLRDSGGYHSEIIFSYDQTASAEGVTQRVREAADKGHFYPESVTRPVYYLTLHEFGHVLDATGAFTAQRTAEAHLLTESRSDPRRGYGEWLDELSRYSLDDGMLDPGEALAEAFALVRMRGLDGVGDPVRALYELLTTHAAPPVDAGAGHDRSADGRPGVRREDAEVAFDRLGEPDEPGDRNTPIEPTSVGRPPQVRIEVDGEQLTLHVRAEGDDRWVVVAENAPLAEAAPTSRWRREWQFIRESWPQHVEQIKYPSGSPVGDSKGQAAIADGISGIADLVSATPPSAPAAPPPTPDHPVIQAPPDAGGPDPTFLRIAQQLPIWIANREKIPLLGRLSARLRDAAGEHLPMRLPDGTEYQPWYTDVNADDVRTQVTADLTVERTTPEAAREALLLAFAEADAGQRSRIVDALLDHDLVTPAEAERLAAEPPAADPSPEPVGPRPDGETLTEAARRLLGLELTEETLPVVQRVIDEQQYRAMRMVGSIEGLSAAVRRFLDEQTMPYGRIDPTAPQPDSAGLPGRPEPAAVDDGTRRDDFRDEDDEVEAPRRRPSRYDDPDPTGRPVPIGGEVSFIDQNPLGRLRDEFLRAFGHDPGLLHTVPIGNGAEPLPEWGDADELGRDDGLRKFFEHALRRDQLRDELATWAASRDVGIDQVATREAADALLARLRAESTARMARVAEFAAAAERLFHPDADDTAPIGARLGDQAARVPFAHGPDRLIVVDGLAPRDHVLAGLLAADPDLAGQLARGELVLDYGVAQTDWSGNVRVEPVATPEVRHVRTVVDGRELTVTLLRDGDGPWRPVHTADEVAPAAPTDPAAPPRSPAAVLRDLARVMGELGLSPLDLPPARLADLIPDLRLDNAVRATQIEALSDFTRSANDIQTFHDVSDARSHLATRLGLAQSDLTPATLVDALTDPETPNALRTQQLSDLVAYAKQLRELDSAAVDAARDRLALRLVSDDIARRMVPRRFVARVEVDPRIMALLPPGYTDGPDGKRVYAVSTSGLSPKKLRKLLRMLERDGQHEAVRAALREYADALHAIDAYSEVPRGDESADPRVVDGRLPMHDAAAVHHLRDVVAAAMRGRDGTDFAQAVAEAAARPDSGPLPGDPAHRPTASRDWARIVGVDITDADDATFRKVYEAYRDGRIERHEGLTPTQLTAELTALRGEIRLRADQIDTLERLLAELDAAWRAGDVAQEDPGRLPGGSVPPEGRQPSGPIRPSGDSALRVPDEEGLSAPELAERAPGEADPSVPESSRRALGEAGPSALESSRRAPGEADPSAPELAQRALGEAGPSALELAQRALGEAGPSALELAQRALDEAGPSALESAQRAQDEVQPDPAARIDAASERESAALDDAFDRAEERSSDEHERVIDNLDRTAIDIEAHTEYVRAVGDLERAREGALSAFDKAQRTSTETNANHAPRQPNPATTPDPSARIEAAHRRESAAVDKAFTAADDRSAADHERVADDLDQVAIDIEAHTEYVRAVVNSERAREEALSAFDTAPNPDTTAPSTTPDSNTTPLDGNTTPPRTTPEGDETSTPSNTSEDDTPPPPNTPDNEPTTPRRPWSPTFRSHIPHPPREFDPEFPDPLNVPPTHWPDMDLPPTPPTHPEPPTRREPPTRPEPPHPPSRPEPPTRPEPPQPPPRPAPPTLPEPPQPPQPEPPTRPELPLPPTRPEPPKPPVPPVPPIEPDPYPPVPPAPPQPPVPPTPTEPPLPPTPPANPWPPQPPSLPTRPGDSATPPLPWPPELPPPPPIGSAPAPLPIPPGVTLPPWLPEVPSPPTPPQVPVPPWTSESSPVSPSTPGGPASTPVAPSTPGGHVSAREPSVLRPWTLPVSEQQGAPVEPVRAGAVSNAADGGAGMPYVPMVPPGAGAGAGGGEGARRAVGAGYVAPPAVVEGEISVRPFAGYGVRAEFDPVSGALRAMPGATGANGVYGDLGGVSVVFYRDRAGLALRVGDRMIELDGPVGIEHGPIDPRHTRFAVTAGGGLICELFYRSLPREMDLGAHVYDVLADPVRRTGIFADRP